MPKTRGQNKDTGRFETRLSCSSCELIRINGLVCHETGCPDAWQDYEKDCFDCGCAFKPESKYQRLCADCTRESIIGALYAWIRQRPGLEFGNYGDWKNYRSEMRSITQDLHDAQTLLRAIQLSSLPANVLKGAFRAYSGRLEWKEHTKGKQKGFALSYCTGQYWPTEYRKAVCAVAASALWDYYRDDFTKTAKPGESAGDAIRRNFRQQYGRRMQQRWFN